MPFQPVVNITTTFALKCHVAWGIFMQDSQTHQHHAEKINVSLQFLPLWAHQKKPSQNETSVRLKSSCSPFKIFTTSLFPDLYCRHQKTYAAHKTCI